MAQGILPDQTIRQMNINVGSWFKCGKNRSLRRYEVKADDVFSFLHSSLNNKL